MTTKATHTPGAIRAARLIGSMTFTTGTIEQRVAEIIDRETAAPEMLEALETIEAAFRLAEASCPANLRRAIQMLGRPAIQKARAVTV